MQDVHALFTKFKSAIRLEEIIRQRGIPLQETKQGQRLVGWCPFHQEQHPGFTVYVATQRYYCFGCGASGDVFDFFHQYEDIPPWQTLVRLMSTAEPLPMRRMVHTVSESCSEPSDLERQVINHAQQCYQAHLRQHTEAQAYLLERGLDLSFALRCGLGYVPPGRILSPHLTHEQRRAAERIGLLNSCGIDRLSGRLVIAEQGKEGCSWLIGHWIRRERIACAMRNLGLRLRKPLIGATTAFDTLARYRQNASHLMAILVVKGALDWLYPLQWQVPVLPVALVGTRASQAQRATLLQLYQQTTSLPIIIGLGADAAGQAGCQQLMLQLASYHAPVAALPDLEDAKDLGELARRNDGATILRQALNLACTQAQRRSSWQYSKIHC